MSFTDKLNKKIKIGIVIIFPLVVVLLMIYVKYFYKAGYGTECFTYRYLGIYCMGCGSTRQLHYLLNGDIKTAINYNVGAVIIYPTFIYLYYLIVRWGVQDKEITTKQAYILAILAGILLLYMILRNIPLSVFEILRP